MAAVTVMLSPILMAQMADSTEDLLRRLDAGHDYAAKERILLALTRQHPDAGPALLVLAKSTANSDTRWMAMRGMATLHYTQCAAFLEASLSDPDALVRANAARALSDLRIADASADLLAMFAGEKDPSALQQGSLALQMLGVRAAAPYLRAKIPAFTGQTRSWLIQALGSLGDLSDAPLIAVYLNDGLVCDDSAASALEALTGVDFGPLKMGLSGCPEPRTIAARAWWQSHKGGWPRCDDCHPSVMRQN